MHAQIVGCTQTQVCNLIRSQTKITLKPLLQHVKDSHHYQLTSHDIKELLAVDYLVIPPQELQPWIQSIVVKRNELNKKTFFLQLPKDLSPYQNVSKETLAHFWYYPEILCQLYIQLQNQLSIWKFESVSQNACPWQNTTSELKEKIDPRFFQNQIVITHNSLSAYLISLGFNVTTLMSGDEHHHLTSEKLKLLQTIVKTQNPIIWILENNIPVSIQIEQRYFRKGDIKIWMDTNGQLQEDPTQSLINLTKNFYRQI